MKQIKTLTPVTKYLVAAILFVIAGMGSSSAQKFAYVDSDYILNQLPSYKAAQNELNDLSEKWQKEVDKLYSNVDQMYKDYNAEKVILTSEQRKVREQEIIAKEKEVKEYQNLKFGYEGELFKKRQELIKPIQDRVFEAIQIIAKRQNLDFIFDKSGEMVMLFSNSRYDVSAEVLEELGVTAIDEEKKDIENLPDENLPPR